MAFKMKGYSPFTQKTDPPKGKSSDQMRQELLKELEDYKRDLKQAQKLKKPRFEEIIKKSILKTEKKLKMYS